jgi:hypothetical protein
MSEDRDPRQPGYVYEVGYTRDLGRRSVRPGWRALVDEAFDRLPDGVAIQQVKQKWGRLTIYTSQAHVPGDPYLSFLNELARRSTTICELCGEPGELRTNRDRMPVMTLCDRHRWDEMTVDFRKAKQ